jgi:hypothetical protein
MKANSQHLLDIINTIYSPNRYMVKNYKVHKFGLYACFLWTETRIFRQKSSFVIVDLTKVYNNYYYPIDGSEIY